MGKNQKVKRAVKAFTKERMLYTLQKNSFYMTHTYISCVMKLASNAFVCTLYDILMLHMCLSVAYNLKCYNSY